MKSRLLKAFCVYFGAAVSAVPTYADDSNGAWTIEAEDFQGFVNERRLQYTGNVRASQGAYRIAASELVAHFNEDNEVVSVEAFGSPAVLTDTSRGKPVEVSGNRLTYNLLDEAVTVEGESHIRQGRDWVRADRATYDIKTDSISIPRTPQKRVRMLLYPKQDAG